MATLLRKAICLLKAAWAFLRFRVGILLIRRCIGNNRSKTPEEIFAKVWGMALRYPFFFRSVDSFRNRFSFDWRSMLFLYLMEELSRAGVHYRPRLRTINDEVLWQNPPSQPVIVATIHSPVDAALNRVFAEKGVEWTLLAAGQGAVKKADLLGLEKPLDLVTRTSDALLTLRRKMREGKIVCADVDFAKRRRKSLFCDICLSPVLFQLAVASGVSVFYAYTRVTEEGIIEIEFGKTMTDMECGTALDYAEDFIAWLRNMEKHPRNWKIREWKRGKKDKLRKFVLNEKICAVTRA